MESIAAERLNKIGKNPSMVSQREDLETDLQAVNELLQAQEEVDHEGANSDNDRHGDSSSGNRLTGGMFRVKSESCFRLSLVPSMIKPAAIAATTGSGMGSHHKSSDQQTGDGSGGSSGPGNTNSDEQQSGSGGSGSGGVGGASGGAVNQSKSSFNLHNLLR